MNLVPFIDLFSTIVIFLLSTAVWDQLAGIQANLGAGPGSSQIETPKELTKKVTSQVHITVTDSYLELSDENTNRRVPIVAGTAIDTKLVDDFVTAMREKYSDKKDIVIFASDSAVYENLIAVMDRCLGQNFTDVVVTGLGEARKM